MKLVKQKKLFFSEGNSDKVYEVDLCESGSDLFVVNFRYGRRLSSLREGTKTIFPVSYNEALIVFDKLINSKKKKGYKEHYSKQSSSIVEKTENQELNTKREETILNYLTQAKNGTYTRNWKISRVIRRAGVLKIKSASKVVPYFLNAEDDFEQYNAIFTLAQLEDTSHAEAIYTVFKAHGFKSKVGRIAAAYLLLYGNESLQLKIQDAATQKIPNDIQTATPDLLLGSLAMHAVKKVDIDAALVYYVYLYSYKNTAMRVALYYYIEQLPLEVNTFKSIRYIYRAAQLLKDFSFLALISKTIAISRGGYTGYYFNWGNDWGTVNEEKIKENPRIAFSAKTKFYFNRETYSYLYQLGKSNAEDYLSFATALLCAIDDKKDNQKEEISYSYEYTNGTYKSTKIYYPKYDKFIALIYILYGGGERLLRLKNRWYYTQVIDVDNPPREEAFSELWNDQPTKVLHILAHAKAEESVQFGLRIIKDNPHFLEDIPQNLFVKLVQHYHPKVIDLMLHVLIDKYDSQQPESEILISLLKSQNEKAIEKALHWLETYETAYFETPDFVSSLLLTGELEVVYYLQERFKEEKPLISLLKIKSLQAFFDVPAVFDYDYLIAVNELIGHTQFGVLFREVPKDEIIALAASSALTNKLFAANFSKFNRVPAYELFKDSLDGYIDSDEEVLRKVGVELIGHFPEEFLLENQEKVFSYCFSKHLEVREAIQPSVKRLATINKSFEERLFQKLIQTIVDAEIYEGIHESSYKLLNQYYSTEIESLSHEYIMAFVLSDYEFAQKIGTPLFFKHIDLNQLDMRTLVNLGHSPVRSIRESLLLFYNANGSRINYELEEALHIFNSDWEDIIQGACDFFENNVEPKNWTIDLLLFVCDHTKEKVQAFGRRMITSHFGEEKGLSLLLKLQEHPAKDMQFFITNYLNGYAKDNVSVILKLAHFFKTNLFHINSSRAAKTRIFSFLEQESVKNIEVAQMTVKLLTEIMGTTILKDKNHCIDILLTIQETHPTIEIPILIQSL